MRRSACRSRRPALRSGRGRRFAAPPTAGRVNDDPSYRSSARSPACRPLTVATDGLLKLIERAVAAARPHAAQSLRVMRATRRGCILPQSIQEASVTPIRQFPVAAALLLSVPVFAPFVQAQDAQAVPDQAPRRAAIIATVASVAPIGWLAYKSGHGGPGPAAPIVAVGGVLGPLAGYAYGGAARLGIRPAVMRLAVVGGTAALVTATCSGHGCGLASDDGGNSGALMALAVGGVTFVVMTTRDINRIPSVVRQERSRVSVAPMWIPQQRALGAVVHVGTFRF